MGNWKNVHIFCTLYLPTYLPRYQRDAFSSGDNVPVRSQFVIFTFYVSSQPNTVKFVVFRHMIRLTIDRSYISVQSL